VRVGPDLRVGPSEMCAPIKMGEHVGSPLQNIGMENEVEKGEHIPKERGQAGSLRNDGVGVPLSQVVQGFKSMTTNEYMRGVKQSHWPPFPGKLWQRNYYEHIIRNQADYERIANYILTNPSNWAQDEENR